MKAQKLKWYKSKVVIALGILIAGSIAANAANTPAVTSAPAPVVQAPITLPIAAQQSVPAPKPQKQEVPDSGLSNDNYYTNTYGNEVHSPAYSNSVPAGASAQCRDGSYSFSQSRRGTCSHHGGVAEWL